MPTHTDIERVLADVEDPLLGESVTALGMVYAVKIQRGGRIVVELLAPAAGWPGREALADAVRRAVESLAGVAAASVQWIDQPTWTPHRLTSALRTPLNLAPDDPSPPSDPWTRLAARLRQKLT